MPVKIGKKTYGTFGKAAAAVAKQRGISKERAEAYVAAIERREGVDPRTGKHIKKKRS